MKISILGPIVALALGTPTLVAAQAVPDPMPGTKPMPSKAETTTDQTASPGQIAANPDKYIGRKVQIRSAEIETVHGQQVFTLDEDRLGAGPDVAVIIPKIAARATVSKDAQVDVTGTVRKFVGTEIKRDYAAIKLDSKTQAELEGRPVVIADSVKTTKDGRELVSGATTETQRGKEPARSEQPEAQPQSPPPQPVP